MRKQITPALKRIIGASQKWECNVCSCLLPASFQIDHIKPLHEGGCNSRDNLQALCPTCHSEKSYLELYHLNQYAHNAHNANKKNKNEAQTSLTSMSTPELTKQEKIQKQIQKEQKKEKEKKSSIKYCRQCNQYISLYFYHNCPGTC